MSNLMPPVALLMLVTCVSTGGAQQPASTAPPPNTTQLVMLGTGTPNPDPERSGPSVAVVRNGKAYLVDAGPGLVRRAATMAQRGMSALAARNLNVLFLTHLHSDHTIGLPDVMLTPWVLEREVPLEVYGPPGTKAMVEHLLAAYDADLHNRLTGRQPATPNGWKVNVHEVAPGQVFSDGNVTVTAFAVPHGDWQYAFGYRFDSADRSIVISGDTRASDAVVTACNGCDLLVHEVISAEGLAQRTPDWQAYHHAAHTTTMELAALGMRAAPKLLLLYHQLYSGVDDVRLLAEIRAAGYTRPLESAHDLGIY
ncbi:MAG: MBL fold metallo-hydrolase [Gemmatimonadota bacterium]|nr:MBL fold metallo-hydrolase [Gemmatimonadota bacterium]